ncbi:uncharacterized protein LOC144060919 isoform X2 [Vanacampus margaritifer]
MDCMHVKTRFHTSLSTIPQTVLGPKANKGTKAPQGRGEKIHTNSENAFITAEVMKFQDFKEEGSESAVKIYNVVPFGCRSQSHSGGNATVMESGTLNQTTVEDGDVISANSVCQEKKSESNSWRERDKRRSDNRRRTRFLLRILVGSNPSPCQGAGSLNSDSFAI